MKPMSKQQLKQQQGMTFIGAVLVIAAIMCFAVVGMKVAPAYMEYNNVKNSVKKINSANAGGRMSKSEINEAFGKSASIDNIQSISAADLVVDSGVVRAEYQKVIPIVGNASVLLDFNTAN
jgi:3-hydroxyacyl-CoA dehydrogenase